MKVSIALIAASVLLGSSAAYAFGDVVVVQAPKAEDQPAPYGSYLIKNEPVKQNPFDSSNLNQSPIRGKGRIKVVHNEPAPNDPAADITKALWLLQDNNYQCRKAR